jgi:hypothetical protein
MKPSLAVPGIIICALLSALILWPELAWCNYSCDTLYLEVYPPDTLLSGRVRVSIYVTHDDVCGEGGWGCDSLSSFIIPLCYSHTNPARYCSLSQGWNNVFLYPVPESLLQRSIYRHYLSPDGDTLIHDWMMDQSQKSMGLEWDYRSLDLDDSSYFRFAAMVFQPPDQAFWAASRVLLSTMTFQVEDTMTICVDTCFWPPNYRLSFGSPYCGSIDSRSVGNTDAARSHGALGGGGSKPDGNLPWWDFVPRTVTPHCLSLRYPVAGDVTADGLVDLGDVVFLLNYLYRQGPAPPHSSVADVNGDELVNIGDVVFLINYLFKGGSPPG